MRKFLIAATMVASSFALSVGGAQAALSPAQTGALAGLTGQLSACATPAAGGLTCAQLLVEIDRVLASAAVSEQFKSQFLKASVLTVVRENPQVIALLDKKYSDLYQTASASDNAAGCTFAAGSPSAACT